MNFAQRQRDPRRHLIGFTAVVLFHAALVYALVTGLAKKVVDVVRAPIETKVIEEIKKPPPPPEIVVPPPPRLEAPPPPFIPPPEVQIATPPPPQPTITAVTPTPPPAPVVIAPAPPPAPVAEAPPAPPPPKVASIGTICTKTVRPEVAVEVPNDVVFTVSYVIQGGKVTKVDVVRVVPAGIDRRVRRGILNAIEAAAAEYVCPGDFSNILQEFSVKASR